MTAKKVVIVGGVAGGMSAATRLRRRSETTQIVVFDRGPYVSFANCGLPYHLGGEIADRNKLIVQSPERLRAVFNLDVRDAKERDGGAIPGSVHIPLGELRHRLAELPKDKLILAHCASGQRSYNACRLLSQHGFRCRNLSGSYKTWAAGTSFRTIID